MSTISTQPWVMPKPNNQTEAANLLSAKNAVVRFKFRSTRKECGPSLGVIILGHVLK